MTPTTLTVEPKDIEQDDILVSDLGQRVALPILYADGYWFVYSTRDRLIRMLAMDATVEVIRNVDDDDEGSVEAEADRDLIGYVDGHQDDCPPRGIARSRGMWLVTS